MSKAHTKGHTPEEEQIRYRGLHRMADDAPFLPSSPTAESIFGAGAAGTPSRHHQHIPTARGRGR